MLKSRDITLPIKVHIVKAVVFPVVMYGCESWTTKKAECQRIDAFELQCWRRLFWVSWTARRLNQCILKEISLKYSLVGLMLKRNSNPLATWWEELTPWKRPWCWERLKAGREGGAEDEMVRWHHRLNGPEFEQTPGVGDAQGSLVCCSPWDGKESVQFSSVAQSCPSLCNSWTAAWQDFQLQRQSFQWIFRTDFL